MSVVPTPQPPAPVAVAAAPVIVKQPLNLPVVALLTVGIVSSLTGLLLSQDAASSINSTNPTPAEQKKKKQLDTYTIVSVLFAALFIFVLVRFSRQKPVVM
jgi:hypothetical protein